jgi:hypothetical protein
MNIKTMPIFIGLILVLSSVLVSANSISLKIPGQEFHGNSLFSQHVKTLDTDSWDDSDSNSFKIDGDVQVRDSANSNGGEAFVKCEMSVTGTEEGEAYFSLWKEWNPPGDLKGSVRFSIGYDWVVDIKNSWVGGGYVKAIVGFTFFVKKSNGQTVAEYYYRRCKYESWDDFEHNEGRSNEKISPDLEGEKKFEGLSFSDGTTYLIGVKAEVEGIASMFGGSYLKTRVSIAHSTSSNDAEIKIMWDDRPPKVPDTPAGPKHVNLRGHQDDGLTVTYITSTTDPDGEEIYYEWDFGGTYGRTGWIGPFDSGETVYAENTWVFKAQGDFDVRVRAKGSLEVPAVSEWSEPLPVKVPKTREIAQNSLFYELFMRSTHLKNLLSLFF